MAIHYNHFTEALLISANNFGYYEELTVFHPLREHLRTHKAFTKDHCFYLDYHKFSIKFYVLDVY